MRLLTFSVLRNYKFKTSFQFLFKNLSVDASHAKLDAEKTLGDPSYIEILPSWKSDEEVELRSAVLQHMRVLPNFVSEEEEASLLAEVEPQLKRMRYEYDHWDNAIEGYRETERSKWNDQNAAVISRVKRTAFSETAKLLPHVHILDLAPTGHIKPHIDAVRFCGDTIAGLCLCSGAVMRLQHAARAHLALLARLERRCLYVMSGAARYEFSHAVRREGRPAQTAQTARRRVALLWREQPRREHTL